MDLVNSLKQLGAEVECVDVDDEGKEVGFKGCPPVKIKPYRKRGRGGGETEISGRVSSQFLSSLLMSAPMITAEGPCTIKITDTLISAPYVALTTNLMSKFGVTVETDMLQVPKVERPSFQVPTGSEYRSPGSIMVEGDASSASYFLAGGAMTNSEVTVIGCGKDSVQVRRASV